VDYISSNHILLCVKGKKLQVEEPIHIVIKTTKSSIFYSQLTHPSPSISQPYYPGSSTPPNLWWWVFVLNPLWFTPSHPIALKRQNEITGEEPPQLTRRQAASMRPVAVRHLSWSNDCAPSSILRLPDLCYALQSQKRIAALFVACWNQFRCPRNM
jgi:hypothetical protein